jgi:hypothetical protein
MKAIIIAIVSLTLSSSVFASGSTEGFELVKSKHKNFFVFKTERKLIGAKIDVFSSNGDLITSQKLDKKRMVIDFHDAKFGTYTICITKGNRTKLFQYIKK